MAKPRRSKKSARPGRPTGFEPEWVHDVAPIELLRSDTEILVETLSDGVSRMRAIVSRASSSAMLEDVRKRLVGAVRALVVDPATPQSKNLVAALIHEAVREAAREIATLAIPDADLAALHRDRRYHGVLAALDSQTTLLRDRSARKLAACGVALPPRFDEAVPLLVQSAVLYAGVRPGRSRANEVGRPTVAAAEKVLNKALQHMGLPRDDRARRRGRSGQRVGGAGGTPPARSGRKPPGRKSPSR